MSKRCYIAGAGEYCENILPKADDYVIAADNGYTALLSHEITPDMIIGDFDSLHPDLMDTLSKHPNVIKSPAEKDDTDMMLAVKQGLKLGFKTFIINGGLGGRLDQTLANMQILVNIAENDARGILVGNTACATAVRNDEIMFATSATQGRTISIFSAGDMAEGVTLKGLKYPLNNATLTKDDPIGVSNEFTDTPAVVSVENGTLLIIWDGGPEVLCET